MSRSSSVITYPGSGANTGSGRSTSPILGTIRVARSGGGRWQITAAFRCASSSEFTNR